MKVLSFVLLALVGTMILELPLQSYADPQLDILLNIATQARDNLSATISQTNNVSDEIKQLFTQGSDETDQLSQAINQQDVQSAKQHFLAAMKFFKETNDKINSLNTSTSNDQQAIEITQLRSEIMRLEKMETLLKNIATSNNINVDFTKFDQLVQTAQNNLDAGGIDSAITAINAARDFLVETHNSLVSTAQETASARAKDFTERQIERFSKMNEPNPLPTTATPTIPASTKSVNATSSVTNQPTTVPVQNYSNTVIAQNPEEMIAALKKLVSEGKVDEALQVIKMLQAYQQEKQSAVEQGGQQSQAPTIPNVAENTTNNTSTTVPSPVPINPPTIQSSTIPTNTTRHNVNSTTTPPTIQSSTIPTNTTRHNVNSTTTPPTIQSSTIPPNTPRHNVNSKFSQSIRGSDYSHVY
jgi:hypothetical protein